VLQSREFYDRLQQLLSHEDFQKILRAIIRLQMKVRQRREEKFQLGRDILRRKMAVQRHWQRTINKYKLQRNVESELVQSEVLFHRELSNLERYCWHQQVALVRDIENRSLNAQQKGGREFN